MWAMSATLSADWQPVNRLWLCGDTEMDDSVVGGLIGPPLCLFAFLGQAQLTSLLCSATWMAGTCEVAAQRTAKVKIVFLPHGQKRARCGLTSVVLSCHFPCTLLLTRALPIWFHVFWLEYLGPEISVAADAEDDIVCKVRQRPA